MTPLKLLVGLGNPGSEYEDTRHNAGFAWIDAVASQLNATLRPEGGYFGIVGRTTGPAGTLWLLKPMTYMNLSGKSVASLTRFFKIRPEEILVVHDELDLAPGEIKLKQGGGNGGHNGLKDIQAQLGDGAFWRMRLGIGHPGHKDAVAGYVLRRAPSDEREALDACIQKSLKSLSALLSGDMVKAVQQLHAKPPRPKSDKPQPAAPGSPSPP